MLVTARQNIICTLVVFVLLCRSLCICAEIPVDFNSDEKVNIADFSCLASDWQNPYDQQILTRFNFHWLMDSSLNDGVTIGQLYTDNARYEPGQDCTLTVYCENSSLQSYIGDVSIYITKHGHVVHTAKKSLTIGALSNAARQFIWTTPTEDFQGYLVEAWLDNAQCSVTAVDVSSDWKRYPRYGYTTEFYTSTSTTRNTEIMNDLSRNYHINCLQYYDWMWRHEKVIETNASGDPKASWTDWRGEEISYSILQDSIAKAQDRNMAAMPYFQIYVGLEDYDSISSVHSEWGLYSDSAHTNQYHHSAGSTNFWVFDPSNVNWQNHMCYQYTSAMLALDWDGIHLDQLGNIGNDTYYNYYSMSVDLEAGLKTMVDRTKNHLDSLETAYPQVAGRDAVIFNIVNGGIDYWAVDEIFDSKTDVIFSEIWDLTTYDQLSDFARHVRDNTDKPVVFAAYVNYGEDTDGVFDTDSVLLADAAIFASGAFHIELGDGEYMLAEEFYPSRQKIMSDDLQLRLQNYYNYITAYEQLLFAPDIRFGDCGNQWINISGYTMSGHADPGTIWFLNRATDEYEIFHLINLLENDALWKNAASTPTTLTDLSVTMRLGPDSDIEKVYVGSPDYNNCILKPVKYTAGSDSVGDYITITLDQLEYWDTIFVKRSVTEPSNAVYEAEKAIKTNVSVNTDHSGYSGTGFVDQFYSEYDSVSFYITVSVDGTYDMVFRYANGGTDATRSLIVDDENIASIQFSNSGDWDTWTTVAQQADLAAGSHHVVLYYGNSDAHAVNLDYLQVQ